jgi:hypothetical protein
MDASFCWGENIEMLSGEAGWPLKEVYHSDGKIKWLAVGAHFPKKAGN